MDERDLIRDTKMALDDLVGLAPNAPSLESITAGYAPLRHVEPALTRWRPAVILLAAAAVTLLVVGIASLIGSNVGDSDGVAGPGVATTSSEESMQGIWVLSTYTFEGATRTVDEEAITARGRVPAWIEITTGEFTGYTGCNRIERVPAPTLDGNRLVFGEIVVQAGACDGGTPESALLDALGSGADGVAVAFTDDTMIWTTDTVSLTFEQRDQHPVVQPRSWSSTFNRLDCSPGVYLTQTLPDTGKSLTAILMNVPGVATVEEDEPFSWGVDNSGSVIAGAAYGDTEPRMIELKACASQFGIRPGADLAGATLSWTNGLGLAQTSPLVWGPRIVELCSTATPNLGALAQQYLDEDAATSVRDDGNLPSLGQTTQTLETIQRSTCAADRPQTATTTTIITSTGTAGVGNQPEITDDVVSPSWVTLDDEDPGAIIQSVLDGGERPTLSDTVVQTVIESLPSDGWVPYLYRASMVGDTPTRELVDVYLGNADVLSVTWYYRWDDTPGCDICEANSVLWDNGWMVWTDADPTRGIIQYHAFHPDFPLNARIVFFPDPIEWPEATAEDEPVLRTQPGEAAALAISILDSLANTIPMPDGATP